MKILFARPVGSNVPGPGGKMSGEAASVELQKWLMLYEEYVPDNILNVDETGYFYNVTPDRT